MSFQPVNSHITGVPVPIPHLARHEVSPRVGYEFEISDGYPTLPLKSFGEILHEGQKVPFRYAIDANTEAWLDNAKGGALKRVKRGELLAVAKDEHTEDKLRAALGLPKKDPAWMKHARAAGWRPPKA